MMRPFALVSYWVLMHPFKANRLLEFVRKQINVLYISQDDSAPLPPPYRASVVSNFIELLTQCEELSLPVAAAQVRSALSLLECGPLPGEGGHMSRAINTIATTIEVELSQKLFFFVPGDRVKFYGNSALFGDPVEDRFPSASNEISEAGKCYALGRYSASVYHLMRVLEVGLRVLAAEFSVPFGNDTWNKVLDQIDSNIRGMSSATHGPDWKDKEQFYSEAAAYFRVLKNAWRNYAMHLRDTYDEERAMEIFNTVRAFMRHLSTRLHE